jgi:hypothetical protein
MSPFAKRSDLLKYRRAYNATPKAIKARAGNVKARRLMAKKLGVKPTQLHGDVHHVHAQKNGGKTTMGNLKMMSVHKNRGKKPGKKKK